MKTHSSSQIQGIWNGVPERIRTSDLQIRNLLSAQPQNADSALYFNTFKGRELRENSPQLPNSYHLNIAYWFSWVCSTFPYCPETQLSVSLDWRILC